MPSLDAIASYFQGALMLMQGDEKGLRRLDLSADGFWQSFAAIPVALPPIALSWVQFELYGRQRPPSGKSTIDLYLAHAIGDGLAWVVPILILVLIAKPIGYSRKIVPLVVASNWGAALIAWALAPYWLALLLTGGGEALLAFGLVLTLGSLFFTVRLVSVAIGRDIMAAIGIVALTIIVSLVVYGVVADLTGILLI